MEQSLEPQRSPVVVVASGGVFLAERSECGGIDPNDRGQVGGTCFYCCFVNKCQSLEFDADSYWRPVK